MAFVGRKAHIARLKRLSGPAMERELGKALFAGGERVQVAAQISITEGAVSGRNHTPSLPGEAPNQNTGHLGGAIETIQKLPLLVEVSSNAEYAASLEFGTSKMAARPYMAPASRKERPAVEKLIVDVVKRLARRN